MNTSIFLCMKICVWKCSVWMCWYVYKFVFVATCVCVYVFCWWVFFMVFMGVVMYLLVYVSLCVCRSAFVYLHQPHNHAPLWKDEKQNQVSRWLREQEGKQYELINRPTLSQVFRRSCCRYKSVFQEILSQLKKSSGCKLYFTQHHILLLNDLASFARGAIA